MEPQLITTTKSFWDWTTISVVVLALVILGVGVYFTVENNVIKDESVSANLVEEETNETKPAENLTADVSKTINNSLESGSESGEVSFVVSSKNEDTVREIQVHNPVKDSWILVYDGYRQVSATPTEIYKTFLAPIKYDRVTVRTVGNYYQLDKDFIVSSGAPSTVNLEI